MKYSDYDKRVMTNDDLRKLKLLFEQDIINKQSELEAFIDRAEKRIAWINQCEIEKKYTVLGNCYKEGRNKNILLIIRYEDGSQRDERYFFNKISDVREKVKELKAKYSGVDWSDFRDELQ